MVIHGMAWPVRAVTLVVTFERAGGFSTDLLSWRNWQRGKKRTMWKLSARALGLIALLQFTLSNPAVAEQIIAKQIEYSNDFISDQGKPIACVVTLVVVALPDPRTLNFQFLWFKERAGWKITGGKMNLNTQSMTALRARDGRFSSISFLAPGAFSKSLTPEGQLLGVLIMPEHLKGFITAFFSGPYSIAVTWDDSPEEPTYYIPNPPPDDVYAKFLSCVRTL